MLRLRSSLTAGASAVSRRAASTATTAEDVMVRDATLSGRGSGLSVEAAQRAAQLVRDEGVVVLPGVMSEEWIAEALAHTDTSFAECMERVGTGMPVGMEHGYSEIVHRAEGRFDMLHNINDSPCMLREEQCWLPAVEDVLAGDVHKLFNGMLMTLGGSSEQLWHADGAHLFPGTDHTALPPSCLNVFIPLVDITAHNGGTEFCLGSHTATGESYDIAWQDAAHKEGIGHTDAPIAPTFPAGSIVIFDYRILHRGLAHTGLLEERRPVAYFTYGRTWYNDTFNFPDTPMPAAPAAQGGGGGGGAGEGKANAAAAASTPAGARGFSSSSAARAGGVVGGVGRNMGRGKGGSGAGGGRLGSASLSASSGPGGGAQRRGLSTSSVAQGRFEDLRQEFPALVRSDAEGYVICDGPGGSQVHESVPAAMVEQMVARNANVGGHYQTSVDVLDQMTVARAAMADLLHCAPHEVTFGNNSTTLTFMLARSLARGIGGGAGGRGPIGPGDNIVVSELDHDCNVGPWVQLAKDTGAELRWIPLKRGEDGGEDSGRAGQLDLDHLPHIVDGNTRVVACGYASNIVGTINDVERVVAAAKEAGAVSYIDAVHYAPHGLIDVERLDCDFLICSVYKFFGPHVGVLYGKTQWMDALQSFRVRPASNELPTPTNYEISKWEMGTQNYEGLVGSTAAVDYLASISEGRGVVRGGGGGGGEGENEEDVSRRGRIEAGWAMVGEHEDAMARRFLGGLESIPGVELYGIDGVGDDSGGEHGVAKRTATFSLTKEGLSPDELAFQLVDRGIHAASGNFYALAFSEALGLEAQGGLTRVGFLHYNNSEDVDRTLEALEAAKVDGEREQRVGPKGY